MLSLKVTSLVRSEVKWLGNINVHLLRIEFILQFKQKSTIQSKWGASINIIVLACFFQTDRHHCYLLLFEFVVPLCVFPLNLFDEQAALFVHFNSSGNTVHHITM